MNLSEYQSYEFKGSKLLKSTCPKKDFIADHSVSWYLDRSKTNAQNISEESIDNYFINSRLFSNVVLHLLLCDDSFDAITMEKAVNFDINRSPSILNKATNIKEYCNIFKKNFLQIKVREIEFKLVCKDARPWEDLSIGFQCRIDRDPNVYNSDFWFYFTNIYTNDNVSISCNSNNLIPSSTDNEKSSFPSVSII